MECYCGSGKQVYNEKLWDIAEGVSSSHPARPMCPCQLLAPGRMSWAERQLLEHEEMVRIHAIEEEQLRIVREVERKAKERAEAKPGNWYLITLTQPESDKSVSRRIECCKKVLVSKQVKAEQWAYSIELTERGTPHIHIALFTYAYPEFRVISKFNDGHRVDVTREKMNVRNYIVKNETKPTPEQLAEWGLDNWFFCSENYSGTRPENPVAEN